MTTDSCHPRTATGDDVPQLLRLWAMLLFEQDDLPVAQPWRMHARQWFDRFVDDVGSAWFGVTTADNTTAEQPPNDYDIDEHHEQHHRGPRL